jgi:hypothetical protein
MSNQHENHRHGHQWLLAQLPQLPQYRPNHSAPNLENEFQLFPENIFLFQLQIAMI